MPDPASPTPVQQLEFDLTINQDRALFREDGLQYQGSVGPYAVYKVTSANPRLVGPYVDTQGKTVGFAMLCGSSHYFTTDFAASTARMQLLGGHSGAITYVESEQLAMQEGNCAQPKDQFGNPIPDGGDSSGGSNGGGTNGGTTGGGTTGGGTTGGGTNGGGSTGTGGGTGGTGGCTSPDPNGCNPGGSTGGGTTGGGTGGTTGTGGGTGGAGGCTSPDPNGCTGSGSSGSTGSGGTGTGGDNSGGMVLIQRLNISFADAPQLGSTVLLRRVALTGARSHNGSHIIPNICCGGGQCTLGAVQ